MVSWNFTSSEAAIAKAGAGANTDVIASVATLAKWSDQAEGKINALTRIDWVTNPPNTATIGILDDIASDLIAIDIITHDMGGYTTRLEALTMINVLDDSAGRSINKLATKTIQEKMV